MENFIIDNAEPFRGFCLSSTYTDSQGIERVRHSGYLAGKDVDLTVSEYLEGRADCRLVSMEEFDSMLQRHYASLVTDTSEITEKEYWEALEVLPPEHWVRGDGFEHFRMCEYWSGTITQQYATNGRQWLTKRIDTMRPDTWISATDFQ